MLTPEDNAMLTRVGPGTPAGEMLRRYWWPVAFSAEVGARPVGVRLLGQDLVLFRQQDGGLGLLERYCAHRRASLEYGRVEPAGLRCCYHGWLFARDGRCLEQPAEPIDSTFHTRVKQPAYQAQEVGGLVFGYLGPEPAPLLPKYDLLYREDGTRILRGRQGHCNWLHSAENAIDMLHLPWLHASVYPDFAGQRAAGEWGRTPQGLSATLHVPALPAPDVTYLLFPSHNRFAQARVGNEPRQSLIFRVPVDDTATLHYFVDFMPHPRHAADQPFVLKTEGMRETAPGAFDWVEDGWWGIPSADQDRVVQESQGAIADRSEEHLGASDRGIILFREMVKEAIAAVAAGRDPLGVIRDPAAHTIVDCDAHSHLIDALPAVRR